MSKPTDYLISLPKLT